MVIAAGMTMITLSKLLCASWQIGSRHYGTALSDSDIDVIGFVKHLEIAFVKDRSRLELQSTGRPVVRTDCKVPCGDKAQEQQHVSPTPSDTAHRPPQAASPAAETSAESSAVAAGSATRRDVPCRSAATMEAPVRELPPGWQAIQTLMLLALSSSLSVSHGKLFRHVSMN